MLCTLSSLMLFKIYVWACLLLSGNAESFAQMDGTFWWEVNLFSRYAGIIFKIFFKQLNIHVQLCTDVLCYARQRNSRHIHNDTSQHENIQPFTSEKRLGGVHSHKYFLKPIGTFWK